jgi:hypothetical protein
LVETRVAALLVGIFARLAFCSRKGLSAGSGHEAVLNQPFRMTNVDRTPLAFLFARSEALHVGAGIDALANTVDPAKAKRLVESLGIDNAGFASGFL